jgi:DNA modification methylase
MRSKHTTIEVPESLLSAVLNQDKVVQAPHSFYRYPARFSPVFARETILAFTSPGDTVLDPFCGGGTTMVEAISTGRKSAGFDISTLATFISKVKTSPLSIHDKRIITNWISRLEQFENTTTSMLLSAEDIHYHRNLPSHAKRFFERVLTALSYLSNDRQKRFVRLGLLRVGQAALDCRDETPPQSWFLNKFKFQVAEMLEQHFEFISQASSVNDIARCRIQSLRRVINRSSEFSSEDARIPKSWLPAKLVLTSPPYPGIHVVYHRWQVNGRKETPTPFWLADCLDGAGEAYYTLGRRDEPELRTYYNRLKSTFESVRGLLGKGSILVQLVAFSNPAWQLPMYLKRMEEAGFRELKIHCGKTYLSHGRVWRAVPGRKWYVKGKENSASKEVLLIHRPDY